MKTPKQSKAKPRAEPPPADDAAMPPWLPTSDRWQALPEAVRQAVPQLLVPAYRQFVPDAPGEVQRSVGLTLVHCVWPSFPTLSPTSIFSPPGVQPMYELIP